MLESCILQLIQEVLVMSQVLIDHVRVAEAAIIWSKRMISNIVCKSVQRSVRLV